MKTVILWGLVLLNVLLLTAFVGLNQWLFAGAGSCPASLALERLGIERGCRR